MSYVGFSNRLLVSVVILLSMLLTVSGCSHRAVHGTSKAHKAKKMNVHAFDDGQLSSLDELAGENSGGQSDFFRNDGTGTDGISQTDGLLSQETLEEDDGGIKTLSPADLAKQYWRNRQQAELMTNRSGLGDVFFELDSWELTEEAKRILAVNAEFLKSNPTNGVTIEGHCDERGTRAYNYVLGEKRALRVRNYLTHLGVSAAQLTVMSYGKDNPLCRGNSDRCFEKNRRAHFLLGINVADARSWEQEDPGIE